MRPSYLSMSSLVIPRVDTTNRLLRWLIEMGGKLGIVTKAKCSKCGNTIRGSARRILRKKPIKCSRCGFDIPANKFKLSLRGMSK